LDIFQDFEITNWRLLAEEEKKDFDIAFIEGAVTTPEHIKLLKAVRETAKVVVAIGACAISGNVFAELSPEQRKKLAPKIYDEKYQLKAKFLDPVEKHIKVDKKVPGCPPNLEIFQKLLKEFKKTRVTSKIADVSPPEYVAKIEGHGRLKINFKKKQAEFEVEESERLVEGLLLGKNFAQAPFINARICGICPIAHNLCSWKAIENALGITPTPEVIALREMLSASQIVKSHLLHLFFLVLPDFAGLKSSIELSQKYPAEFHLMLNIKRMSEKALQLIGGSTTFPVNTGLGGFQKPPALKPLLALRDEVAEVVDEAEDLIKLFASFAVPAIESPIKLITTKPAPKSYPLYQAESMVKITESLTPGSTAKVGRIHGRVIKVGALARLTKYHSYLNPKAKKIFSSFPLELTNPYHNNLAQAVETLHFLEEISRLVEVLMKKDLSKAKTVSWVPKSGKFFQGEACLEAPRGVLIHQVKLDKEGKIMDYNIIPPTQINLASLRAEAQLVLNKRKGSHEAIEKEIEMLIRAFDPCITCAVH
jgi:coenzyme F420-reducing hydrogenase alpha subunit/Ni,Fe-hydrogenase III small subunit